jgi:hypothetical protein
VFFLSLYGKSESGVAAALCHRITKFWNVAEMSSRRHVFETGAGFNMRVTNEGLAPPGIAAIRGISRTGDGPGVLFF